MWILFNHDHTSGTDEYVGTTSDYQQVCKIVLESHLPRQFLDLYTAEELAQKHPSVYDNCFHHSVAVEPVDGEFKGISVPSCLKAWDISDTELQNLAGTDEDLQKLVADYITRRGEI